MLDHNVLFVIIYFVDGTLAVLLRAFNGSPDSNDKSVQPFLYLGFSFRLGWAGPIIRPSLV